MRPETETQRDGLLWEKALKTRANSGLGLSLYLLCVCARICACADLKRKAASHTAAWAWTGVVKSAAIAPSCVCKPGL